MARILTEDAQEERDEWAQYYDGCTCHMNPPCNSCTHPGNPVNQAEDKRAWETVCDHSPLLSERASQ